MRIRCPSCSATYEVPGALLDQPRTVRCARCSHDWVPEAIIEPELWEIPIEAPSEVEEPEPSADAEPTAVSHEPRPTIMADEPLREPESELGETPLSAIERLSISGDLPPAIRRRDRLLTAAWAVSFAALTALGVAGYTERDALMREWPASKRLYTTLGLAPGSDANDAGAGASGR